MNESPSMQETPLLSLGYDLVPGHSLGPFVLGASLWKTLEYLRESKVSYPQVNVKFDPENPVTSPIILHVVPYLDLLFSGAYQRLHTISIRRLQPTGLGMPLTLRYKNSILASPDEPLRKSGVTRVFGPTYPGDVMRYPGVWFGFQEDGEDLNKGSTVGQGDDRISEVRKVVIRQKALEDEARDVLDEVYECSVMSGELSRAIVKACNAYPALFFVIIWYNQVHDGITLHFHPSTSPVVRIRLGTSAEDLNCDLGPPLRVHYKEDDRMNIHASSGPTEEGTETDCEIH
jgi:phagosome assembly factor 1